MPNARVELRPTATNAKNYPKTHAVDRQLRALVRCGIEAENRSRCLPTMPVVVSITSFALKVASRLFGGDERCNRRGPVHATAAMYKECSNALPILIEHNRLKLLDLLQDTGSRLMRSMGRVLDRVVVDNNPPRTVEGNQIGVRSDDSTVPLELARSGQAGDCPDALLPN